VGTSAIATATPAVGTNTASALDSLTELIL
jgi:hypothetical protein